ncbi:mitosis inhibitor protein kinase swe1 [Madurella fahalii]|uniref:Mitosis inhibitor protein kinase swe1 n=1 Tax=Madurella fahalii TaxID=1157608 RepID=A0ABQ0GBN1_9PEZI
MPYSNGSGGTLTLPSPTHVHHVDVSSAVRSLRRSLSRSPSKFRLSAAAASPTPATTSIFRQPPTPSSTVQFDRPVSNSIPATPAAPAGPTSPTSFSAPQFPTASGTPFARPSIKLSVRSTRSKPLTRPLSRSRLSPKSPLKRVFGPAPDAGNPIPQSTSDPEARGQENATSVDCPIALSPTSRRNLERPSRHSVHLDISGSSKNGVTKFLETNNDPFPAISVSPLKRSDATMSLGQTSFGSPVAKRRSLHGISSLGTDSTSSDQNPTPTQAFDIHEDADREYQLTGSCPSPFRDQPASPIPSVLPKRSSSLRKSTLQQRHGDSRSSLGRRAGEKQLAQFASEAATPNRNRPRLSLDQYVPPEERGSPFVQASLVNPTAHPAPRPTNQPHPLSRSLTQSSSGSSLMDDSPTHIPVHFGQRPRVPPIFSKSLPPGSQRPTNDSESVATPQYKQAKPLQAAFMSTGLVSKMNRNPEFGAPKHPGTKIAAMPDTPCKKQPYNSNTYPPQHGSGGRRSRISLGSPSTPFSSVAAPMGGGNSFGTQDKSGSLFFQQVRSSHNRKASLLSLDGDELAGPHDDLPPTPTKNLFFKSVQAQGTQTPSASRAFGSSTPAFVLGADSDCKFDTLQGASSNDESGEVERPGGAAARPSTPFSGSSPCLGFSIPSLAGSRTQPAAFTTPAPTRTSPVFATVSNVANHYSKTDPVALASPLNTRMENPSPHTPQDSVDELMAPPDPSSLSISNLHDGGNAKPIRPPATPTTSQTRQLLASFAERRLSITPQNGHGPGDVDESLMDRFDRAEIIGKGEFSQVYRVVKSSTPSTFMTAFSTTPRTPSSPDAGKVYAVKKLRIPFHSAKARETKLQEVAILQTLSHSSKIVQFIDSWEYHGQLYIQTEYCAEGSLDRFLGDVGQTGRLDDFRIWKILLETAQGLAVIHNAGFIHLDLKPANLFITFDGYLKIGDFGMATRWPAAKGIEGEGDREYIGPEILLGQYDKPADIFALGLIILEIACNVFLPDNGPVWQALRSGDLSIVPALTCGEAGAVDRDANGVPIDHEAAISRTSGGAEVGLGINEDRRSSFPFEAMTHNASNLFGTQKRMELRDPPSFMLDPEDPHSLDNIVRWMIQPDPADRPTADQLLASEPVSWISSRRVAGATVYEGNWGPQIGPSVEELVDTEMTDV